MRRTIIYLVKDRYDDTPPRTLYRWANSTGEFFRDGEWHPADSPARWYFLGQGDLEDISEEEARKYFPEAFQE